MRDTEIIDLYFERNEQAIAESEKSYGRYCHSIAYNILRNTDDSDECVNDTWLKAWSCIPPQYPEKLAVFLGTITRNLSIDRWKKRNAAKRGSGEMEIALDELQDCIPSSDSTIDTVEAAELEKIINDFLHSLSERECNIFLRRYWFMEEYSVIAKKYGINLNTLKTSIHRTRKKLKSFLEEQGIAL